MEPKVSFSKLALMYYCNWNLSKTISKHDRSLSHVIFLLIFSNFQIIKKLQDYMLFFNFIMCEPIVKINCISKNKTESII